MDIDLLGRTDNSVDSIVTLIREISQQAAPMTGSFLTKYPSPVSNIHALDATNLELS
jgi:hypothetical protein